MLDYTWLVIIKIEVLLLSSENSSSEKLNWVEKQFHMKELGTNVKKETLAGITTFVSMAYILFVNPSVLGDRKSVV